MMFRCSRFIGLIIIVLGICVGGKVKMADTQPAVLPQGHAHNDYLHTHPLFDALEQGYMSVEADVCLQEGVLYVAHDPNEIVKSKTLEKLYLIPLRMRVQQNKGYVYEVRKPVILMIDLKTDAESTYAVIRNLLNRYRDILSVYENGKRVDRAVQVVISGNRSLSTMKKDKVRYANYDGRMTDLGSREPNNLISLISDRWTDYFKWAGSGPMPKNEREKLQGFVRRAHADGRRVRFWATDVNSPQDQKNIWKVLQETGVDYIGTDKLEMLRRFLLPDPQK